MPRCIEMKMVLVLPVSFRTQDRAKGPARRSVGGLEDLALAALTPPVQNRDRFPVL